MKLKPEMFTKWN